MPTLAVISVAVRMEHVAVRSLISQEIPVGFPTGPRSQEDLRATISSQFSFGCLRF